MTLSSQLRRPATAAGAMLFAALTGAACSSNSATEVVGRDLPVWETEAPALSVGTLDGEEVYEFGGIQGVISTPGGGIAVSDAVTGQVSLFDSEGEFVRAMGALGEGPGEFGLLSRIYAHGTDSIAALDQRRTMVSWFSLDGDYGHMAPAAEVSGEDVYEMDVFPASRYIVDGAADRPTRERVGRLAATLPKPTGSSLVRMMKVATDGGLWIEEVPTDSATASEWLVLDGEGRPQRWVRLPAGFTPFEIEGDRVTGRRTGEYGVEYAERYLLGETEATHAVPDWFAGTKPAADEKAGDAEPMEPMTASDLRTEAISSIKFLASGQEIFYSRNYRYASSIDEILAADMPDGFELDLPEDFEFRLLTAGQRGWAMVVAHPDVSTVCTLGYGVDTPPGWGKGSVDCGSIDGIGGSPPPWESDEAKAAAQQKAAEAGKR